MPRPFKWAEYFHKDAALQNRSNKYQVSCLRCQKKIPKGRSEERTRHLVEECTGLTPEERAQILREEAEVAAVGTASKPVIKARPPGGGGTEKGHGGGLGDAEAEELMRLVRVHHPLESGEEGWQLVDVEYNNWAEANGFRKRAIDALKKQWNLRVNTRPHPASAHPSFTWDVPEARVLPWEALSGLGGFDDDDPSGADTDHDALNDPTTADLGAPNYSLPPPRFDPELNSAAATPPQNLSPPQSANSSQQRQPTQYRLATMYPRPMTKKMQEEPMGSGPDRVPPASSSFVDFLEYENMQKAKRIEKLEARADKLEEKVDRLDARNRKLEDQNRKLEQQNQLLKMQIMVSGGGGGAKRRRGNSEILLPDLQDVMDD